MSTSRSASSPSMTLTQKARSRFFARSKSKAEIPNATPWTEQEIKDLRAAFTLLDKNSDGRISPSELHNMLKTFEITVPEHHILRIIERASSGGTSGLTEPEFIAWILPLLESEDTNPDQDLMAAFQVFDKDKNGYISRDELKTAMEMMGEVVDDAELDQLIILADLDRDGRIDYGEFARLLS